MHTERLNAEATPTKTSPWVMFLTIYLAALALLYPGGYISVFDDDDVLRGIQIRRLLSPEGSWWDLTLPMIGLPDPYVSPWSRLVDLPYVLVAKLLAPFLGLESAVQTAFQSVPLGLLALYCLMITLIWRRMAPINQTFTPAQFMIPTMAMSFAIYEFSLGRIDHHNMQLVALMAMAAGVARWDYRGGIVVGLGAVASVAIGLEGLPIVTLIFAGIVVAFLSGNAAAAAVTRSASATVLAVTIPAALILLGPSGMASTQCDAFSSPYILLMMSCAGSLYVTAAWLGTKPFAHKLTVCALLGLASLAITAALFPQCLDGPYGIIDPTTQALFMSRIPHESGLLVFGGSRVAPVLIATLTVAVLLAAAPEVVRQARQGQPALSIAFVVALASFVLTLLASRYLRFSCAFVPLFAPLALQSLTSGEGPRRFRALVAIVVAMLVTATTVWARATPHPTYNDAAEALTAARCVGADMSALSMLDGGHVLTTPSVAMSILAASDNLAVSVGPIPFHRAFVATKWSLDAFLSEDAALRRDGLSRFDYLAFCRPRRTWTGASAPLLDALAAGRDWPGLTRVSGAAGDAFQVFRIDHERLE